MITQGGFMRLAAEAAALRLAAFLFVLAMSAGRRPRV